MDLPAEEQVVAEYLDESSGLVSSARRKRFIGAQSTWRQYTYEERLVSTSLTRLRDQDLSAHLYNAHAMKSCQCVPDVAAERKPEFWAGKHMWRRKDGNVSCDINGHSVPPKSWTAWPLPANLVPRASEQIGLADADDAFTFKRQGPEDPSQGLEDVLTGTTLRIARKKFEEREWDSPVLQPSAESATAQLQPSNQVNQVMLDVPLPDLFLKESSEPLLDKTVDAQYPVISSDDDRSREILQPTIRHTLSQLDKLLMALHYARQNCVQYGPERTRSRTERDKDGVSVSETENDSHSQAAHSTSETQLLRKRGRPRKVLDIPDNSSAQIVESEVAIHVSRRGRPKKVRKPLPGETYNEMLVRIARALNQKLPFQSTSNSRATSAGGKPPPRLKRSTSEKDPRKRQLARLGLRDWSEIIGTAALVGFSPVVISRAAQRCANLFGEGMTMHSLEENPVSEEGVSEKSIYVPEKVPDFVEDSIGEPNVKMSAARRKARPLRRRAFLSQVIKDDEGLEELGASQREERHWCSFRECPRHKEGFSKKSHLFSHLKSAHKLEGDDLENALEDGNEEMFGAVHVDGFLKEIKTRQGWRSHSMGSRARSTSRDQHNVEDV